MLTPSPLVPLWFTPLGLHRYAQADSVNGLLARVLRSLRATDPNAAPDAAFYASRDDLLQRIRLPEWDGLVRFIVDSLRQTVVLANQGAWPEATPALQIALRGVWFQMSNQGSHHDVHTHGNCSWSGVYCVDVDEEHARSRHPALGAHNGVTRFYGPHFNHLGGAHMDFGNAYLQSAHFDIAPRPGQLVVFPSWLPHQALPYAGEADRIIVSFNASVHAGSGSDQLHGYAHA
ncbi:TIGR02466 family protein [Hydrogenophaga sp.]|uniref:TIGR02466 family protein n=1 Tax=Hydrogenophaga sp. TaxID=1904254 RepID=UPI002721B1CD|nr:TIGR02466 family protein [Hydrogenophaga sp.]MDO8904199.1 TIGR02466 family protein [Hydrogenophaga sp.]